MRIFAVYCCMFWCAGWACRVSWCDRRCVLLPSSVSQAGYLSPLLGPTREVTAYLCLSSPLSGGVGFDINCGVRLVRTNLTLDDVLPVKEELTQSLFDHIPVGVGTKGVVPVTAAELNDLLVKQKTSRCIVLSVLSLLLLLLLVMFMLLLFCSSWRGC